MKKIWFALALGIVLLPLPAASAAAGKVTGHLFQSDQPKLDLKIADEFRYLDQISHKSSAPAASGGQRRRIENEIHLFAAEDADRRLKKVLFIHFRKIDTHWLDRTADSRRNLDFDVMDLQGYRFRHYKRIEKSASGGRVAQVLADAGYTVPQCQLRNAFYIIPTKDLWVTIHYWEDAAPSHMSCDGQYTPDTLSRDQKRYLDDFHRRSLAAMGIGEAAAGQPAAAAVPEKPASEGVAAPKPEPGAEAAEPVSVSVFHFTPLNMEASAYGITATNTLIHSLKRRPSFVILDRRDLETFLSANDLQQNDRTENMVHIGSRMGLNIVIAGTVEKKGPMVVTTCKAIGIEERKVVFTQRSISAGESDLIANMEKMAEALVESIRRRGPADTN